jgi:uncharacterized damage-inducible protein DinB
MTWTAPPPPARPDGPLVGDDRSILTAFLDWERSSLLNICAGLDGEQLALRAIEPSNLSLLGLIRHLAKVERIWFRLRVGAQDIEPLYDPALGADHDYNELDPTRAEQDFAQYYEECRLADEAAAELPFDHTFSSGGQTYSLRFVYVHMIAEYSRHNGHADLLRERIDGVTGR